MSQGFRKGGKGPEVSDTTGLTPPTRIDQQRNSRRTQQITHLHQQFQDLKKKIKEVQNKNEKIIQKIYKAYNFKKKNAYTQQYIGSGTESPVVHYQNRYEPGFSGAMSVDAHSNKSDQSQKQYKMQKRSSQVASRKAMKNQKFNYSLQYGKTDANIASQEYQQPNYEHPNIQYGTQMQMRHTTSQMPPMYPQTSPNFPTVGSQKKLVQQLSQQKQILEQQLQQKSSQIIKLNSSIKSVNRSLKGLIQSQLQQFYENVCHKNLIAIQKAVKKYEQKIKNVKKIALMVKDKQEDKKSSRLLQYGRQRRSVSRSRRASPPRDNSRIMNNSRDIKDESRSRSRIAGDQGQKYKKQFQQIAAKYQQIIKSKTQQIQRWDKKYKTKQRECYELKMRIDIIQKRLNQQQKKSSRDTSQDEQQITKNIKKFSTQSDLLDSQAEQLPNFSAFQQQILRLKTKIQQLNTISNQKSSQISNLQNALSVNENKNKQLYNQYQQNVNKNKQKYLEEQQKYKKQFEKIILDRNDEILGYKNSLLSTEKKFLQKQCEYFSLESKIKKIQGLLSSKDRKIQQLQKMVGDNCPTDRSIIMNSTVMHANDNNMQAIKKLKQEIQALQGKLQTDKNQIFSLTKKNNYYKTKTDEMQRINLDMKKQIQALHIENQQLKINVNMNNISAVMKQAEENSRQEDDVTHSLAAMDENMKKLTTDMETMTLKINELTREKQQWYDKYQKLKNQNLQKQSEGIKIKSQLGFIQKQFSDLQTLANKLKTQNEALKSDNKQLGNKILSFEQQLQSEREQFKIQLNDIQKRWAQFEQDMRKSGVQGGQLDRTERSSVFSYNQRNKLDTINTQNQYLTVKLKQAQAEIEAQKIMEQKIIDEYQLNMQEYKIDIKNKGEQIKMNKQQIQDLNTKIINLTMRLQAMTKNDSPSTQNRKQQKNQLLERIQQLQAEVKESKEINNKLTDMQGQLFDQIKIKEQERAELYEQLRKRQTRIQQLQQIVQMRQGEVGEYIGSNMYQSSHKRQSIKSQSSLKYSSHSQALRKSRMLNSGKGSSDERLFDLDLSQAGSQFYEQPSQISNISEFFQKEELPYQKIKIKRQQQIKLFEKTASYIKSLKKAIEQKNKKIKLLEKKIESLKQSELVRKQLGLDIEIKQDRFVSGSNNLQADDTFRDYQSVQLQYKRGGHLRRYKQLEHDTKLVMEQNNLLIQQIQTLEQQLLKAEEQQNSLVKIKDLYKEEIKKLIKKNEQQTKAFEEQLKNQRKRVQQSESVHNIQAIKQLYTKIIQITGLLFTQQNLNAKKKQEKRKQLQQYIKVMSNILKLEKKAKDSVLACLHK